MSESMPNLDGASSGVSGKRNNILYAPDNGNPQDPGGRAFAVTGAADEAALLQVTGAFRQSNLFQAVHHIGGVIIRIVHKPGYHWASPLLFPEGRVPDSLAVVREKLNERHGDITMLAYVIAALCDAMGWNAHETNISELNFS